VPAGTYTEYILIQKDNLTIQGAGIDQTIIDLDGLAPYVHYGTSAGHCVAGVLVTGHGSPDGENADRVTGVTIKDLTVKNAGLNALWASGDNGWRDGDGDGLGDVSGLEFDAAYDNTVTNVKVDNSTNHGIYFNRPILSPRWHCKDISVTGSVTTNNRGNGISLSFSHGDFTVNNNTSSGNYKNGIYVGGTKKDTGDGVYYKFSVGEVKNNTIENNTANNASQGGIHLKKYIRDSNISYNTVTGQHLQDEAFGIMLEGHSTYNNVISNNIVTDNVRGIILFGAGGYDGASHAPEGGCHSNSIEANTINNGSGELDGGQAAIKVDGGYDNNIKDNTINNGGGVGIRLTSSSWSAGLAYGNEVSGNSITDARFAGIRLDSESHDNLVGSNIISGTLNLTLDSGEESEITQGDGIFIESDAGTGNVFEDNSISGSEGDGMENQTTTSVDASPNWWGSADDPSDDIVGDVDYAPWYLDAEMTTLAQQDCAGAWNGTATDDECGICSGGDSGHAADSDQDDCGVCFGSNVAGSGDINVDSQLNINDIVMMVNHVIVDGYSLDSCGLIVGDMNSDSIVNVLDIIVAVETILYGDLARTDEILKAAPSSLELLQRSNSLGYITDKQGLIGFELILSHEHDFSIVLNEESFIGDYNTSGNETKIIIVMEGGSELFTTTGKFEIEEMMIGTTNGVLLDVAITIFPDGYSLERAYPNPFNPATTLSFALPTQSEVTLSIYNIQGREVASLIHGNMEAGYHSVVWNADEYGSGIYFVKMVAGEYISTQKLMLVK